MKDGSPPATLPWSHPERPRLTIPVEGVISQLANKPWLRTPVPPEIFLPLGLIAGEERRLLFYLAATYYRGRGVVCDAGAFLGASAFCLAAGLAQSALSSSPLARVLSYDLFVSDEEYVKDFIASRFPAIPDAVAADYLHIFHFQTALHASRIEAIAGDFCRAPAPSQPVELLFVDVAKTPALNAHLVSQFFPRLIPGVSILIQQDFYHAWHPYIHITMQYLKQYFVIIDGFVNSQSRVYLLSQNIPEEELHRVARLELTLEEQLRLLNEAAAESVGPVRLMIMVAKVWQCRLAGAGKLAQEFADEIRADASFDPQALYAKQLVQMQPKG